MQEVKFGLIGGSAFMGKAHSVALANLPMYEWPPPAYPVREVIAEATDELADEAQHRFGFNRSTSDWRTVVEDPDVDVIDVILPNHLHREVVLAALEAGKHVICEKPLAPTPEESKEMLDAAKSAGVVHQVGFNWRLAPAVLLARRLIDDGTIGEVRDFRGFWLGEFGMDPSMPVNWRFQRSTAGSGALGDLGSHVIDYARYLVDEITETVGVEHTYIDERPSEDGQGTATVDVDDSMAFMVRFESGAHGYIEASWATPGRKTHAGFEVHGSEGSLCFDWERMNELKLYDSHDAQDRQGFRTILIGPDQPHGEHFWPIAGYQIGYPDTKIIQFLDFLNAVTGDGEVQTDFEAGWRCALVEHAVQQSAKDGAWTKVGAYETR